MPGKQLSYPISAAEGRMVGGRPSNGIVRQQVEQVSLCDGQGVYECNHCGNRWRLGAPAVTKWALHLLECKDCLSHIKQEIARNTGSKNVRNRAEAIGLLRLGPVSSVAFSAPDFQSIGDVGSPTSCTRSKSKPTSDDLLP